MYKNNKYYKKRNDLYLNSLHSKLNALKLKNHKILLLFQFGILLFFGVSFTVMPSSSGDDSEITNPMGLFNSHYMVENLRGDKTESHQHWNVPIGTSLSVNILNPRSIPNDSINVIKNTIQSQEIIVVDDSVLDDSHHGSYSTYYVGWKGALNTIGETKIPVPQNFNFISSPTSDGDIIVILSNVRDNSGYTGYTKTILEGNQIVKAFITIYDVDSLSKNQLETIMRHEFGHALGLGHSTASKDLMAPVIDMTYPYISICNVEAINDLYNENHGPKTICEK